MDIFGSQDTTFYVTQGSIIWKNIKIQNKRKLWEENVTELISDKISLIFFFLNFSHHLSVHNEHGLLL